MSVSLVLALLNEAQFAFGCIALSVLTFSSSLQLNSQILLWLPPLVPENVLKLLTFMVFTVPC